MTIKNFYSWVKENKLENLNIELDLRDEEGFGYYPEELKKIVPSETQDNKVTIRVNLNKKG